jgi:hypothetical protein
MARQLRFPPGMRMRPVGAVLFLALWVPSLRARAVDDLPASGSQQPDRTPWRLHLTVPLSGVGLRDQRPDFPAERQTLVVPLLLMSLVHDLPSGSVHPWLWQAQAGWLLEGSYPRALLALYFGRALRLLDSRRASGRGDLLRLQAQGGLVYRGRAYDWVHKSRFEGQWTLGPAIEVALEGVRFTRAGLGWSARLRLSGASHLIRQGPETWFSDAVLVGDSSRLSALAALDLGVAW